jgi:hypothetical protein
MLREVSAKVVRKKGILASVAVAAVVFVAPVRGAGAAAGLRLAVGGATFEVELSASAQASFKACTETLALLSQRGWDVEGLAVRIARNPFDATRPGNAVVISSELTPEEAAFELASQAVARQLGRSTDADTASLLAQAVAAHLAAPGAAPRERWEHAWLDRLRGGDLLSTALPELLWRQGTDAAIRGAARGAWPAAALGVLETLGVERPLHALGEVAVAGFLDPLRLDFRAPALPLTATGAALAGAYVAPGRAALQVVPLGDEGDAVAVSALHARAAEAWVAVRYPLTGGFDAVPLSPPNEVAVPLRSLAWAGVLVVTLDADAALSLALRPLPGELTQVRRWDFSAADNAAELSWQVEGRAAAQGYVVEALARDEQGRWTVLRRGLLPASGGDRAAPASYHFADADARGVAAYRLLALTGDGLLAEIATLPVNRDR